MPAVLLQRVFELSHIIPHSAHRQSTILFSRDVVCDETDAQVICIADRIPGRERGALGRGSKGSVSRRSVVYGMLYSVHRVNRVHVSRRSASTSHPTQSRWSDLVETFHHLQQPAVVTVGWRRVSDTQTLEVGETRRRITMFYFSGPNKFCSSQTTPTDKKARSTTLQQYRPAVQ